MKAVPTFYPTEEEFADFYSYLTSIESQAEPYGLCKIVPPASWVPRVSGYDNLDIDIPSPIRQYVQGSQGVYQIINVMEKKMTFEGFKKEAQLQEERGLKAASRRKKPDDKEDEFDELEELERMYWKNLTFHAPLYGADMLGSLFEEPEGKKSSWNLNHLDSLLSRKLPYDIPGVTKPYLYFGMWKAMFGCHTEDMELFSINYLHFGKPKIWYCAPQSQKERFEGIARNHYPHHFKDCSEFLRHKSSMLSPSVLRTSSITLTKAVQKAGEFMVTFPGAYHFGFNIGLNCAESVNFALESWVKHGAKARSCKCVTDSVTIDMKCFDPTWTEPVPIRSRRAKQSEKAAPVVQETGTVEVTDEEKQESKQTKRRTSRTNAGQGGVVARAEAMEAVAEIPLKKTRKRTAKMPKKTSPEKKRKVIPKVAVLMPTESATPQGEGNVAPIQALPSSPANNNNNNNDTTRGIVRTQHLKKPSARKSGGTSRPPAANPLVSQSMASREEPNPNPDWKFSCMCGERAVRGDPPHLHPKGLLFECSQCRTWGHVNCYANFAQKRPHELPNIMLCHLCRVKQHIQATKAGSQAGLLSNGDSSQPARLATRLGTTVEFLKQGSCSLDQIVHPSETDYYSTFFIPPRASRTSTLPIPSSPMHEQLSNIPPPDSYKTQPQQTISRPPQAPVPLQQSMNRFSNPSPKTEVGVGVPKLPLPQPYQAPHAPPSSHYVPPITHGMKAMGLPPSQGSFPYNSVPSSSFSQLSSTAFAPTESKPKHPVARGRYMCGRCGQPKKGHVCPYAEAEQQQMKIMEPRLSSTEQRPPTLRREQTLTTTTTTPPLPTQGHSTIMQQQSQLDSIKQRLQHLQQLQEQHKRLQFHNQGLNSPQGPPPHSGLSTYVSNLPLPSSSAGPPAVLQTQSFTQPFTYYSAPTALPNYV